jgi:formylglycine-generating enzyme required for sulfatase activity
VVLEDDGGEHGVAAFEIARYPITNAQFQAFVDADDGHRATDRDWWQGLETSELADPGWTESSAPREMVSWFEAVAFCRWLAARLRCPVRLPTELEWQQAATCGDPQRDYPWGAWEEGACNSGECGISRTSVVGIFPRGSWTHGPCDLAGNVWEWCEYAAGDGSRVVRGGAWFYPAWSCRSAFRHRRRPGDRYVALGFRLAKFVTE